MKRKKMNLSDEERQRRSDRMRQTVAEHQARKASAVVVAEPERTVADPTHDHVGNVVEPARIIAPEVQAVLDTMSPERKAKLAMIQARTLQTGFTSERERTEALERAQANRVANADCGTSPTMPSSPTSPSPTPQPSQVRELTEPPPALPPSRIGSREVSIIVRTDGTMVSQWGPCICGRAKRDWHKICVKPEENHNG